MRPSYTARRREALHVVRGDDGALEIGSGRLRIGPGGPGYFSRVATALAAMVDLPGSVEALERGDALGRNLLIVPPPAATVPANAWAFAGAKAGMVVFEPADWPRPGDRDRAEPSSVLLKLLWYADGGPAELPAVVPAEREAGLHLSGRPAKQGDMLCFPMVLQNTGSEPVWVMRGLAARDPETGEPRLATRPAVTVDEGGEALVGSHVPPLPRDRLMAAAAVPLVQHLAPGQGWEVRIELPPPYVEASPFLPPAAPERLVPVELRAITAAITWWPAGCEGIAMPRFGAGLYAVDPAASPSLVRARFPVRGLTFGRRRSG